MKSATEVAAKLGMTAMDRLRAMNPDGSMPEAPKISKLPKKMPKVPKPFSNFTTIAKGVYAGDDQYLVQIPPQYVNVLARNMRYREATIHNYRLPLPWAVYLVTMGNIYAPPRVSQIYFSPRAITKTRFRSLYFAPVPGNMVYNKPSHSTWEKQLRCLATRICTQYSSWLVDQQTYKNADDQIAYGIDAYWTTLVNFHKTNSGNELSSFGYEQAYGRSGAMADERFNWLLNGDEQLLSMTWEDIKVTDSLEYWSTLSIDDMINNFPWDDMLITTVDSIMANFK